MATWTPRGHKGRRSAATNSAIRSEMKMMLSDGYPLDQATAIAFRKWRDGELRIPIADVPRLDRATNEARKAMNDIRIDGSREYEAGRRAGLRSNRSPLRKALLKYKNLETIRRLKKSMDKGKK